MADTGSFYEQYFRDKDCVVDDDGSKEYYVIYKKCGNETCSKWHCQIRAHTARQALSKFREKYSKYRVLEIIEWVSNKDQIRHEVLRGKVVST